MRYDLSNEFQAAQASARFAQLKAKGASIDLVEKRVRTLDQNSYLHLLLQYMALALGESVEYVKVVYYKRHCSPDLFITSKFDTVLFQQIETLRSSRDLSVEEMTISIERFREFALRECNEYLPSPDDNRLIMAMDNEVNRNLKYIH